MTYYIATKNKETGNFELWMEGDKPKEIYGENEALETYETSLRWKGQDNIILLEKVFLNVEVKVTKASME